MNQHGWVGGGASLRENGYTYMYVSAPSVFTWNYHILLIGYAPIQKVMVLKNKQNS